MPALSRSSKISTLRDFGPRVQTICASACLQVKISSLTIKKQIQNFLLAGCGLDLIQTLVLAMPDGAPDRIASRPSCTMAIAGAATTLKAVGRYPLRQSLEQERGEQCFSTMEWLSWREGTPLSELTRI